MFTLRNYVVVLCGKEHFSISVALYWWVAVYVSCPMLRQFCFFLPTTVLETLGKHISLQTVVTLQRVSLLSSTKSFSRTESSRSGHWWGDCNKRGSLAPPNPLYLNYSSHLVIYWVSCWVHIASDLEIAFLNFWDSDNNQFNTADKPDHSMVYELVNQYQLCSSDSYTEFKLWYKELLLWCNPWSGD